MITVQITDITKLSDTDITVQASFSDGSMMQFPFGVDVTAVEIRSTIKEELNRLNAIDAKIEKLKTNLIGKTLE
jgi:hypothetical protein